MMSDSRKRPKIVVFCGPTAIGKTGVTIEMAERFSGEVVGADSMQIYRFMDIGTAKPTAGERRCVPHHMIDVADPDAGYDAARFVKQSRAAIDDIVKRRRLPMAAGGTGLYIRAMLYGLCDAKPEDPSVRKQLKAEAEARGGRYLYDRLLRCDPASAERIHPHDTYRVVRALEIFDITGEPMSRYRQRHRFSDAPFDALKIGLFMDRPALYERINRRVEQMVAEGLYGEVENLLRRGYGKDLKPMQALGYRHMIAYMDGKMDWQTAVETLKRDTRRYAKRQLTWFRADPEVEWMAPDQPAAIEAKIRKFLDS